MSQCLSRSPLRCWSPPSPLMSSTHSSASSPRPDLVRPMADIPTVLWTLRNGHRRLECSVQLLRHGLELHLALNGDTPYCSRTFQTQDELLT